MKNFPKYNTQRATGDKGVSLVKLITEHQLYWIFRENHLENDFGIDGYIDIIGEENSITGKSIAVQIKTGESFFKTKPLTGWTFYGDNKHLNYYTNLEIPLLIFIVDLENKKVYWQEFDIDKISNTENGWTILIPNRNILGETAKNNLLEIVGDIIDYMPQIEYQWEINKQLKESDIILLNISKKEVLNMDTSGLTTLLKKLTINDEMIKKSESKLSIFIDGYNHDSREIYEIPEVVDWMKKVFEDFKYWGYFLDMRKDFRKFTGLRLFILCLCDSKIIKTNENNTIKSIEYNVKQSLDIMQKIFGWLNEFTDKFNIADEINNKKSLEIADAFTGHLK